MRPQSKYCCSPLIYASNENVISPCLRHLLPWLQVMTGNRALVLHLMDACLQSFSLVKCISTPSLATRIVDRTSLWRWPAPITFKAKLIRKDGRRLNILLIRCQDFMWHLLTGHKWTCWFTGSRRCALFYFFFLHWPAKSSSPKSNWPHLHLPKDSQTDLSGLSLPLSFAWPGPLTQPLVWRWGQAGVWRCVGE